MIVETQIALLETLNATFDASGIAQATTQVGVNQRWVIELLSITTTSSSQTKCIVYRGRIGGAQLDYSVTGNGDTSNTHIELRQGETLAVQWTGGTAGSSAQMNVEGSKFIRGLRGY